MPAWYCTQKHMRLYSLNKYVQWKKNNIIHQWYENLSIGTIIAVTFWPGAFVKGPKSSPGLPPFFFLPSALPFFLFPYKRHSTNWITFQISSTLLHIKLNHKGCKAMPFLFNHISSTSSTTLSITSSWQRKKG